METLFQRPQGLTQLSPMMLQINRQNQQQYPPQMNPRLNSCNSIFQTNKYQINLNRSKEQQSQYLNSPQNSQNFSPYFRHLSPQYPRQRDDSNNKHNVTSFAKNLQQISMNDSNKLQNYTPITYATEATISSSNQKNQELNSPPIKEANSDFKSRFYSSTKKNLENRYNTENSLNKTPTLKQKDEDKEKEQNIIQNLEQIKTYIEQIFDDAIESSEIIKTLKQSQNQIQQLIKNDKKMQQIEQLISSNETLYKSYLKSDADKTTLKKTILELVASLKLAQNDLQTKEKINNKSKQYNQQQHHDMILAINNRIDYILSKYLGIDDIQPNKTILQKLDQIEDKLNTQQRQTIKQNDNNINNNIIKQQKKDLDYLRDQLVQYQNNQLQLQQTLDSLNEKQQNNEQKIQQLEKENQHQKNYIKKLNSAQKQQTQPQKSSSQKKPLVQQSEQTPNKLQNELIQNNQYIHEKQRSIEDKIAQHNNYINSLKQQNSNDNPQLSSIKKDSFNKSKQNNYLSIIPSQPSPLKEDHSSSSQGLDKSLESSDDKQYRQKNQNYLDNLFQQNKQLFKNIK